MSPGVRVGRYIIAFAPMIEELCRKAGLDLRDVVGYEMNPQFAYSAGRWCNGVDLEPWNRRASSVGAEVSLIFRGGQRLGFFWGTEEPWATATTGEMSKTYTTHDPLGEVAR